MTAMEEFTDSTSWRRDPDELRRRLIEEGYLFFRRLLPGDAIDQVRQAMVRILVDCQWIEPGSPLEALQPGPNAAPTGSVSYFAMYSALQATQVFQELAVRPELVELITSIFGERIFAQPLRIGRVALPDGGALRTRPHQDLRPIQGTRDALTAWIPLTACPTPMGGLRVLAGSPAFDLLPASPAPGPGGLAVDVSDTDPAWRHSDYEVGDVLLFQSLAVHGSLANYSGRLRLSVDFRYQPAADPVSSLVLRPHHHPKIPDWPTLTRGWSSVACLAVPAGLTVVPTVAPTSAVIETPPSRFAAASR